MSPLKPLLSSYIQSRNLPDLHKVKGVKRERLRFAYPEGFDGTVLLLTQLGDSVLSIGLLDARVGFPSSARAGYRPRQELETDGGKAERPWQDQDVGCVALLARFVIDVLIR